MSFSKGLRIIVLVFVVLLGIMFTVLWVFTEDIEKQSAAETSHVARTLYQAIIPDVVFCDGARSPFRYKSNEFRLVAPADARLIDAYQREYSFEYRKNTLVADVALVRARKDQPVLFVLIARKEQGFCVLGIAASSTAPLFQEVADRNQ